MRTGAGHDSPYSSPQNELRDGAAAVKEMSSAEQTTVPLAELAGWLRVRLRNERLH